MIRKRQLIFLIDVIWFTLTAFGGAQAHVGMMLKNFVKKRQYISESELLELHALTQILPGPSSTQTLIGIAYKVGGLPIAITTFIIWILPSTILMCLAVISYSFLGQKEKFTQVLQLIQPVAVGIVAYAAYSFGEKILKSKTSIWLALGSLFATLLLRNAYAFPILILMQVVESQAKNTYNQAVTSGNTVIQSGNTTLGNVNNIINNGVDFLKVFKGFNIQVVSRIGSIFIKTLYEILKKDILNLVRSVISDVSKSQRLKKYTIILRLVNILLIIAQLIDDYRKCKSLITDILLLLKTIFGKPDGSIPMPLLLLTQFLPGTSPERATINTVELLQSVGIPTGVLPDGSPNLMGIYNLMTHKGADKEAAENSKGEGVVITTGTPGIFRVFVKNR